MAAAGAHCHGTIHTPAIGLRSWRRNCGPGRCSLPTRSNSQITVCMDVVAPGTHGDLWSKTATPQSPVILWMLWVVSGPVFNLCRSFPAGSHQQRWVIGLFSHPIYSSNFLCVAQFFIFYRLLAWTKNAIMLVNLTLWNISSFSHSQMENGDEKWESMSWGWNEIFTKYLV